MRNQADLLYFTHPQGVNNSLELRKKRGEAAEGDDTAVSLWALHLRIKACHCDQRSPGRYETSLAASRRTQQVFFFFYMSLVNFNP